MYVEFVGLLRFRSAKRFAGACWELLVAGKSFSNGLGGPRADVVMILELGPK